MKKLGFNQHHFVFLAVVLVSLAGAIVVFNEPSITGAEFQTPAVPFGSPQTTGITEYPQSPIQPLPQVPPGYKSCGPNQPAVPFQAECLGEKSGYGYVPTDEDRLKISEQLGAGKGWDCSDSDNGDQPFIGGTATYTDYSTSPASKTIYPDECVGNTLVERYCDKSKKVAAKEYPCSDKCVLDAKKKTAACTKEKEATAPTAPASGKAPSSPVVSIKDPYPISDLFASEVCSEDDADYNRGNNPYKRSNLQVISKNKVIKRFEDKCNVARTFEGNKEKINDFVEEVFCAMPGAVERNKVMKATYQCVFGCNDQYSCNKEQTPAPTQTKITTPTQTPTQTFSFTTDKFNGLQIKSVSLNEPKEVIEVTGRTCYRGSGTAEYSVDLMLNKKKVYSASLGQLVGAGMKCTTLGIKIPGGDAKTPELKADEVVLRGTLVKGSLTVYDTQFTVTASQPTTTSEGFGFEKMSEDELEKFKKTLMPDVAPTKTKKIIQNCIDTDTENDIFTAGKVVIFRGGETEEYPDECIESSNFAENADIIERSCGKDASGNFIATRTATKCSGYSCAKESGKYGDIKIMACSKPSTPPALATYSGPSAPAPTFSPDTDLPSEFDKTSVLAEESEVMCIDTDRNNEPLSSGEVRVINKIGGSVLQTIRDECIPNSAGRSNDLVREFKCKASGFTKTKNLKDVVSSEVKQCPSSHSICPKGNHACEAKPKPQAQPLGQSKCYPYTEGQKWTAKQGDLGCSSFFVRFCCRMQCINGERTRIGTVIC